MAQTSSTDAQSIVWMGKPWITPSVVARSILIIVASAVVIWLEFLANAAFINIFAVPLVLWTILVFVLLWLVSISNLLLLKATNTYVLRNDSLQIKTGIFTTKSFVVAPSGFANMEVIRTIVSRLFNRGDIIIRTQDEPGGDKTLLMIRDPETVASKIRDIMSKPIVRLEK